MHKSESFESHLATYTKKYRYVKMASHFKEAVLRDFTRQPHNQNL